MVQQIFTDVVQRGSKYNAQFSNMCDQKHAKVWQVCSCSCSYHLGL